MTPPSGQRVRARSRPQSGRTRRAGRGQALVELALILPILILLVAAALDMGRLFYSKITIENAAQQAVLQAARDAASGSISYQANQACSDANKVVCRAVNESRGSFVSVVPADVSVSCSTASCPPTTPALGDSVAVTVAGHFTPLTPVIAAFLGGQSVTVSSTATAQIVTAPTIAATPTPTPEATPTPTPTPPPGPTPTPTPTPTCPAPAGGSISVSPASGRAANNGGNNATVFTFGSSGIANMTDPACNPVWSWSFGDGTGVSLAQNPTHSYAHAWVDTTVTVTLTASNLGGNQNYTLTIELD